MIIAQLKLKNEQFLSLKLPFDKEMITKIKNIKRAHWHTETKTWLVPDTAATKTHLQSLFGTIEIPDNSSICALKTRNTESVPN